MSKREIARRYAKLMADVSTNDFYKVDLTNRVNCYTCMYGHITKTIDRDAGSRISSMNLGRLGSSGIGKVSAALKQAKQLR